MRVLILSDTINHKQHIKGLSYVVPNDIHLDTGHLNEDSFSFSVFDYDVSIILISGHSNYSQGYYKNLPKLLQDSKIALEHGRTVISLPESDDFISFNSAKKPGMSAYEWLKELGIELQDNIGMNIKPSGAGRTLAIQEYLKYANTYYQIIIEPKIPSQNRLAIVEDTGVVVGLELPVQKGNLIILPPPSIDDENYQSVMSKLLEVARHYHSRAQRHIALGDTPEWLESHLVPYAKQLKDKICNLTKEKEKYDKISYLLYGTGEGLEDSVSLLLTELDCKVKKQPPGSNTDLIAIHPGLNIGFAIEVTGTKDIIKKDSKKVAQAWEYIRQESNSEKKNRLIIVANTEFHLDPKERRRDSYTPNVVDLLSHNEVLMITTLELYELWKTVHEKRRLATEIVQKLFESSGRFANTD